jgi:hypothetical protein
VIRIIVRSSDCGAAANVGGPVYTDYRTFDVDIPELEEFLREQRTYLVREVVGVEVLERKP